MSVAVIGMGVVGRSQARLFGDVVTYDIAREEPYPREAIAGCDFAVIAVGTPAAADGSADLTAVFSAVAALPAELPVLIRSTVPPGTTDRLSAVFPGLIAHAPEFLTERDGGPWPESADVPWLILGGPPEARRFFRPHLAHCWPAGVIHECTAADAELIKYTANLHWAAQVTFVSEMAAVCAAHGRNWEVVRYGWLRDARIDPAYTAMAGFAPGFGGACWPKDLAALIAASTDAGYDPGFLRAVSEANDRFRKGGLT